MKYENIENKVLASSKRLKIDNVKMLPIFIIFFLSANSFLNSAIDA